MLVAPKRLALSRKVVKDRTALMAEPMSLYFSTSRTVMGWSNRIKLDS